MMPYATLPDVRALIPAQIWTGNAPEQPSAATVTGWLDDQTRWVDTVLTWRYQTPITDAGDLALLRPIVANLVAARIWAMKTGHNPQQAGAGAELRREALQALAYDARTGRAAIALATTAYGETREAALGMPVSTFPDRNSDEARCQPGRFDLDVW